MRPGGWYSRPAPPRRCAAGRDDRGRRRHPAPGRAGGRGPGDPARDPIAEAGGTDWFRPLRRAALSIEVRHRRGFLTCPWADQEFRPCPAAPDQPPTADEFVLRHRTARIEIASFVLVAHLIRHHGFFGGVGTPIRVEPETLARALAQPPR